MAKKKRKASKKVCVRRKGRTYCGTPVKAKKARRKKRK